MVKTNDGVQWAEKGWKPLEYMGIKEYFLDRLYGMWNREIPCFPEAPCYGERLFAISIAVMECYYGYSNYVMF